MATLLLKKSYRHKDLKEIKFHDLWNSYGVFTTMRVIGRPPKILFFKEHINNLFRSLKKYKINKKNIKQNILNLIKLNLSKKKNYDHLFRVAANHKMISISLRKRFKPKSNFILQLVNYKRIDPEYKNFKVGRYHSLKLFEPFKSNNIKITMRCAKTDIPMGIEDLKNNIYGFQFHPESFLTENGNIIIKKILSA